MSDFAQSLFLRELAKRDVEKSRFQQQQDRDNQQAQARADSLGQAIDTGEKARDSAFDRKLKVAQLESKNAATLGREAPSYDDGAVQEAGRVGYSTGEAGQAEELSKAERAAALERLKQMEAERMQSMRDSEAMKRAQLTESGRGSRGDLDRAAKLQMAKDANATRLKAASGRNAATLKAAEIGLTAGARGKQETASIESGRMLQSINGIRSAAAIPGASQNGRAVVDYESLLSPAAKNQMLNYETKAARGSGNFTPNELSDYKRRKAFIAKVTVMKSQIMHTLSGANVTPQEAERVADGLISYEMNPQEFEAALQAIESQNFDINDAASQALGRPVVQRDEGFLTAQPGQGASGEDNALGGVGTGYSKFREGVGHLPVVGQPLKTILPRR